MCDYLGCPLNKECKLLIKVSGKLQGFACNLQVDQLTFSPISWPNRLEYPCVYIKIKVRTHMLTFILSTLSIQLHKAQKSEDGFKLWNPLLFFTNAHKITAKKFSNLTHLPYYKLSQNSTVVTLTHFGIIDQEPTKTKCHYPNNHLIWTFSRKIN